MNKFLCNTRYVCDVISNAIVKVLWVITPPLVVMIIAVNYCMFNIKTYADAFTMIFILLCFTGTLTATLSYHITLKQLEKLEFELYGTKGKRPRNTKD